MSDNSIITAILGLRHAMLRANARPEQIHISMPKSDFEYLQDTITSELKFDNPYAAEREKWGDRSHFRVFGIDFSIRTEA